MYLPAMAGWFFCSVALTARGKVGSIIFPFRGVVRSQISVAHAHAVHQRHVAGLIRQKTQRVPLPPPDDQRGDFHPVDIWYCGRRNISALFRRSSGEADDVEDVFG